MLRLLPLWALVLIATADGAAFGQEVVEIDAEAGRTIIDDEWRSMYYGIAVVDWTRGIFYVEDEEEPEGIMAFALDNGEWLQTLAARRGDGPGEFSQGHRHIALAPHGGLYVSGLQRVVEFDTTGEVINTWTPLRPPTPQVCNLGGAPAVPAQGGVIRRGPNGESEEVGPVRSRGVSVDLGQGEDVLTIATQLLGRTHIACTDSAAYVMTSYEEGPATVEVFELDGTVGAITVPPERATGGECISESTGRPCRHWSSRARARIDDHGNFAILGSDPNTHGAIINPETGCYALIRGDRDHRMYPVAIRGDSVLALHPRVEQIPYGNRMATRVDVNSALTLSINPIRRVSGEPCEGVLPGVPAGN